jgi:regulator of telomere elongation helicase 1
MRAIRHEDKNEESKRERVVRRKFNPHSPPTTVEIHGIRVHFPFRPYDCQQTYMTKVMEALLRSENALLESPTGTGKTLCLLCACLAWQREQSRLLSQQKQLPSARGTQTDAASTCSANDAVGANLKHSRVPTIIYASRTHSQLSQVVQELRNTRYRPLHAVLGSREQMCVNPKVKKQHSTASDINHDCNKLGKDRKCRYRNGLESFVAPREEGSEGAQQQQAVMDLEDLVELGKQHKICPFYYTRSQVETAELILVPYNYLFDKDARETTLSTIPWDNAVVIFDEAHNLESFASESASFDLTSTDIAGCVNEIQVAINYLESLTDLNYGITVMNLLEVKDAFLKLENYILDLNPDRTAYSGEFMIEILSKGAKLHYGNHEVFLDIIKKVNDMLLDLRGASARSGAPRLEHFVQCVKRVYGHSMESRCYAKAASYRVHVSPKQTTMALNNRNPQPSRTVSFWCFAPSLAMEELAGLKIRSILVTSGTLSPLPSYSLELGIPFPLTLENPHIISKDQIHVRVVGKGVSGKVLSSSFERRKDSEYYTELGNTLVSIAKVTPEGMLVFFPSYSVMETCIERWGGPTSGRSRQGTEGATSAFFHARRRQTPTPTYTFPQTTTFFQDSSKPSTPWQRLRSTKAVVLEPKSSVDLPDAISEFKRFLALPNSSGCVLMGVCRGKISEGIDFAHEQSRAVVITGLPFPPSHDPRVKMKREFLDQARAASSMKSRDEGGFGVSHSVKGDSSNHLSGLGWYTQQAHRAVNQAIGRVIRNASDYGAVLLLDNRFEQPANQNGLSMWLRPHIQKDEGFGRTVNVLSKFFKAAEASVKEKKRIAVSFLPEPVVLEYEADGAEQVDEKLTKIAVVRASAHIAGAACENSDTENASTSYVDPDRVIAKVDFKDLQKRPTSPSWKSSGVPVKKAKASNNAASGPESASTSSQVSGSKPVAAQFFARARSTLSQEDLATLKTVIAAAREQKELKNEKGFIKATTDAVKLLVRCDGLEVLGNERSESNLLLLFFHLLPPAYRHSVELLAMKRTFDRSTLYRLSVAELEPGFFGMFRTQVVSLLHALWCPNTESSISTSVYLTKAEAVLRVILKVEKSSSKVVQSAFLRLVQSTYHSCTRLLAAEMLAAEKMEKRKTNEKAKSNRVTAPLKREASTETAVQAPPTRESDGNDRSSTNQVGVPSRFDSRAPKKAKGETVLSAKPTPLSLLIEKVESEVFVQHSTAEIAKQVPSASDSSMSCPVCCAVASEPFMADCGHIACLECWKTWLARSESCPTCRTATSIESISRIVVSSILDKKSASDMSLSQVCRPQKAKIGRVTTPQVADDDSDGELEIC